MRNCPGRSPAAIIASRSFFSLTAALTANKRQETAGLVRKPKEILMIRKIN
jgi:hypothetical protein